MANEGEIQVKRKVNIRRYFSDGLERPESKGSLKKQSNGRNSAPGGRASKWAYLFLNSTRALASLPSLMKNELLSPMQSWGSSLFYFSRSKIKITTCDLDHSKDQDQSQWSCKIEIKITAFILIFSYSIFRLRSWKFDLDQRSRSTLVI